MTLEDMTAEDDKVVCRFTVRATHHGDFLGIAPTGANVTWEGNPTFRLEGGRIVEEWYFEDHLGLPRQLGAIPAPQPVGA